MEELPQKKRIESVKDACFDLYLCASFVEGSEATTDRQTSNKNSCWQAFAQILNEEIDRLR